jgi:hypothetical protein
MPKESDIRFSALSGFQHTVETVQLERITCILSTFSVRVHTSGAKPNPVPAAQHSDSRKHEVANLLKCNLSGR